MKVEDFVEKHGGRYKNYRGGWLIQCPYHSDNSPSCSLSINGLFNCWGCGEKGNYTRLLHDVAGFSWKKSTELVSLLDLRRNWTKKEKRIYEQNEAPTISSAVLGFYDVDWEDAYALYTAHRGTKSTTRPPWALVFEKGFLPATLRDFEAGYDKDDQRITIPIWNTKHKLLGLLGRACRQGEFKYVPYNNFQYTEHVYNLWSTEEGEPVVLVEGAFDVWMLAQWEIPFTAIATMTSHAYEQQIVQILEKHGEIYVFYDGDPAGWKGAAKVARMLTQKGGRVDIIATPEGVANIKDMNRKSFMRQYRCRTPYPCVVGDASSPHNQAIVPTSRTVTPRSRSWQV
jgi:DNA primase